MKLYILTEGFSYTGYGHITRCLAIANKLSQFHISVSFLVNGDANVLSMLSDFPVEPIAWQEDYVALHAQLKTADILLIDSYLAAKEVYDFLQSVVPFCIYLDDFNRLDYPPGIVVNGTVGAESLPYNGGDNHKYLLGKDFVILREEFKKCPGKNISPEITSVLITFGGTDPLNVTARVLKILVESFPEWEKRVVMGAAFKDHKTVEWLADKQTKLYTNVNSVQMRDLMLSSDIAISAAGQTINELAATGLPSVIYKVADNQSNNIAGWQHYGFVETYIDALGKWDDMDLVNALRSLCPEEKRRSLSECGQMLMDACGVDRLVKKSLSYYAIANMQMALARESDAKALFDLANDPLVRQNSFSTRPIVWNEHIAWLQGVLADPSRRLFVFVLKDKLVGQVRMDAIESDWRESVVSISLDSRFRGWGLAPVLLQKSIREIKEMHVSCHKVYAYIKESNVASRKAFERAGFEPLESDREDALKYQYVYGK